MPLDPPSTPRLSLALRSIAQLALVFVVTANLTGCGDANGGASVKTNPVKGKIILPDGTPLSEGVVTFIPLKEPGRQAAGKVQPDGSFALTTRSSDDGAAEGEYLVQIDSDLSVPTARKGVNRMVVPAKYHDEAGSGLKATVKPGANDLPPFRLDDKSAASGVASSPRARG